jgi:alpha-mannosidase
MQQDHAPSMLSSRLMLRTTKENRMMPFTLPKLRQRLKLIQTAAWRTIAPLDGTLYLPTSPSPVALPSAVRDAAWQPLGRGDLWGEQWQTVWLRQPLIVPAELRGQRLALHLRWRAEATQWSPDLVEGQVFVDDALLCGLDAEHRLAILPSELPDEIFVQAHLMQTQPFGGIELVTIDHATDQLAHTLRVGLDVIDTLPESDLTRHHLIHTLNTAINLLDLREGPHDFSGGRAHGATIEEERAPDRFYASVREALAFVDQHLRGQIEGGSRPQVTVTGHAHIDVAWLWPLWRTRQKTAHTFSTVLHLMEQYPEYHFTASTPQLYAFLKEDYPDLYERVKARIAQGRWEAIGGMWLEADCNLPSGESLVRQFVHGMRFFGEEFGIRDRVLWLPDVFGYSAALPQILRGVGIDTFMTTKISWNQFNRLPHDTFRWRGIDGSDVLAHFVTTPEPHPKPINPYYTYNGYMTPADVQGSWREYRQKAINNELLYLMGYGDGGGGPTAEQLETVRRLGDQSGMPQVRHGSAAEYFARLHERVDRDGRLPTWVGELYLEYHRGTYTGQAWIKGANRRAEQLYHEAEFLDAWASVAVEGYESQRAKLNEGWKLILLNQFHDIIPGSSIRQVYEDAREQYEEIERIAFEVSTEATRQLSGDHRSLSVVNSLGWDRRDPVFVSDESYHFPLSDESRFSAQEIIGDRGAKHWLISGFIVPSYGVIDAEQAEVTPPTPGMRIEERLLENQFFRIELDERGEITSIFDKRYDREVLAPGERGNQLIAFEDRPLNYDAWDIDIFYEEKAYPIQHVERIEVIERGPIRGSLLIVRRFQNSEIHQRIRIYSDLPRIDFDTTIHWSEHQILLKAEFPVAINSPRATYEIQFGAVERSTHRNTSWDVARFETCAHRWVDLSEGGYGVALLNDSKYGHDIHGNTIRLTLLKSGVWPDATADQGTHNFTYSLLPHAGDWREGEVVRRAAELNSPLHMFSYGDTRRGDTRQGSDLLFSPSLPLSLSFLTCDADHVMIDTIKTAEDGDGIIVRVYEAHNQRGNAILTFAYPIASAEETNLLEERAGDVAIDGQVLHFAIRPFEIKTFRVRFGR